MPSTVAQSAAPAADCRSPYNDCEDLPSYDPSPAAAAAAAAPPIDGLGDGDAVAAAPAAAAAAFTRDAAVSVAVPAAAATRAAAAADADAKTTPSEAAVTPPSQPSSPPSPPPPAAAERTASAYSVGSTPPPPAAAAAAAAPQQQQQQAEAAAVEDEGQSPPSPLPSSHVGETVSDEVWENERWLPSGGWRAPTSIDRSHFSDKSGSHARAKEGALLPHLWVWAAPWQVDTSGHASSSPSTPAPASGPATPRRTAAPPSPQAGGGGGGGGGGNPSPFELPEEPEAQAEAAAGGSSGWYYARSFTTSISQCKLKPAKTDVVRRRRWARVRRRVSEAELADLVRQGAVGGAGHWVGCERYGFAPPSAETAPPASVSAVLAKRHHSALRAWRQHLRSTDPKHAYSDSVKIEGKPGDVKGKLKELVRRHGVPPSLRARVWMACSGAVRKKEENEGYYRCVIEKLHGHTAGGAVSPTAAAVGGGGGGGGSGDEASAPPASASAEQGGSPAGGGRGGNDAWCEELEKDLQRTFCDHPYFGGASCPGRQKLKRVLSALSYRNPLVNYCQSFNYIAGCLLLNMPEEDSFWMMVALLEQVLPNDYYNANLVGITVDIRVLGDLIALLLPTLAAHFAAHNIDVTPLTAGWLMNLYVNTFPIDTTMRVWDLLFSEGPKVIFRVMIGLLRTLEPELLGMTSLGETLEFLTLSCKRLHDPSELLSEGHSVNLGKTKLGKLRERHRRDVTKEVDMRKHISELERRGDDPHDGAAYPALPVSSQDAGTEEEEAEEGAEAEAENAVATEAEEEEASQHLPNPGGEV